MQKALSHDPKIYDSSAKVTTENEEDNEEDNEELEEEMDDEEIDQAA